jgi:phage-related protein
MTTIGTGVKEIRVRDEFGAFRLIYVASLADAVYVLHTFQKTSQRTSSKDLALAEARFRALKRSFVR